MNKGIMVTVVAALLLLGTTPTETKTFDSIMEWDKAYLELSVEISSLYADLSGVNSQIDQTQGKIDIVLSDIGAFSDKPHPDYWVTLKKLKIQRTEIQDNINTKETELKELENSKPNPPKEETGPIITFPPVVYGDDDDDDTEETNDDDDDTEETLGDDDTGPTGDDDTGPTGDDDTGPTGDDDTGPTGDDDTGPTGDDDTGPTGDDDTGPTGDDDDDDDDDDDSWPRPGFDPTLSLN